MELFAPTTPMHERWYTVGIGALGFGVALMLLRTTPWWLVDFGMADAAKAFGPALTAFIRAHPSKFGVSGLPI